MASMAGSSSRPVSSSSHGRRSRSQSRSRSRAGSVAEGQAGDVNGYGGGSSSNGAPSDGTDDFCNNFWGHGTPVEGSSGQEGGYEILMSRMKSSGRMVEELRGFFKERAAIEEDYARRLAKLARQPLGRDETGEFANVLKRVQYELDQTGRCHNELANVIRSSLEARVKEFEGNRDSRRKNLQLIIEKSWKNKQSQEALVQKALEKYKSDCILINSFSARLSLTQGKDMDKVTAKLDKAQQTVQVNEAEYKNYLKALSDTNNKWNNDWKAWCDLSQDLEEERIDFARNALWSFVNALSLLCVKDDESCESVRQSIETCDVTREIQSFIHRDGGASLITDSPHFVDFSDGDKGFSAPAAHRANFSRSSAKIEIAPFDGLEKLQALIYPQQGQQRRSVAGTPAPISSQPSPAPVTPAHTGTPHTPQTQRTRTAPVEQETTPQAPVAAAQPQKQPSPVKKAPEPPLPDLQPPVPPAAFSATTNTSRSRPSSRAGGQEDRPQTTAEALQYQASQKRTSAGAFRTSSDKPTSSPHYPYAANSPRTAKPYEPPAPGSEAETALRQSSSGVLPPPLASSTAAPAAPEKDKKAEDPLLAALAKLRNPSSAVDILPPSSPGVPSNIAPGAVGLPGMTGRPGSTQQMPRSHSPYSQPVNSGPPNHGQPPRSHSPYGAAAANARSNPNIASSYQRPMGSMSQSASQPGPMYGQQARSRPTSPQPPSAQGQGAHQIARAPSPAAAMMRPPSQAGAPQGVDHASAVAGYGQSFPGERRAMSVPRPQSSQGRPASPGVALVSPSAGFAGVGATGAPYDGQAHQQYQQNMRSPSPAPQSQPQYGQHGGQQPPPQGYPGQPPRPQSGYDGNRMSQQGMQRPSSAYGNQQQQGPPQQQQQPAAQQPQTGRPTTPLGIALDARGSVTQDQMADRFNSQRQQAASPRPYSQQGPPPPSSPYSASPQANLPPSQQSAGYRRGASILRDAQNRQSMTASPSNAHMQQPPPQQQQQQQPMSPSYGYSPAAPQGTPNQSYQGAYQQQQHSQQQGMASPYAQGQQQQRPPSQNISRSQSVGYAQQQHPGTPQTQQMQSSQSYRGTPSQFGQQGQYQQPASYSGHPSYQHQQQQQPQQSYGGYSQPQQQQQYQAPQQHQQQPPAQQHQATGPAQQPLQAPSSTQTPPTGQYTESGHPVLFYVKAIYKYDAASPEEFSFQKDDVIGVFETDDDGWWKGELLDPDRARRSGGNLFPSNFTNFLD